MKKRRKKAAAAPKRSRHRRPRKRNEPNPKAGTFEVLVLSEHGQHRQNSLGSYDDAMKSARGFEKDVTARGETARVVIREHTPTGTKRRANW
jgi:hypothetical protein